MKKWTILQTLRMSILSTILALVAMVVLTFGASAHTTSTHASDIPNSGAPAAHIVQGPKNVHFSPKTLSFPFSQGGVMNFVNDTNVTQVVLDKHNKVVATLPAGQGMLYTFNSKGTFVFHLQSNPRAKETVTLT